MTIDAQHHRDGFCIDAHGRIVEDVLCAKCRYSWRGLDTTGRCPECGAVIAWRNTLQQRSWGAALSFLITNVVFLFGLTFVFVLARPHLVRLFEDFDTELPVLTRVLVLPHPVFHLASILLLASGLAAIHFMIPSARGRRVLHTCVTLFLLLFAGVVAVALVLPLVNLVQSVTG